ncbi:hypothetical protein EZV73_25995 [Acidaminobacter sp. JC074]|uniref:hypothetical protein n=1 Tax=Acidaminobacter sp. JC074 TaxID=2530199 RepID=UPI001F0E4147|nr:hypothetical protein [Acidaminobacter sp. JC074]MCH4891057.1 hypothetical protein [Acidaminobacter sp. JC074]
MKVISHIPGRMRIRSDVLKKRSQSITDLLALNHIIKDCILDERVGSLLIFYDSSISKKQFQKFISVLWRRAYCKAKKANQLQVRGLLNTGMIVTLTASMIAIYTRRKYYHALYGYVFLALALGHVVVNKKQLNASIKSLK